MTTMFLVAGSLASVLFWRQHAGVRAFLFLMTALGVGVVFSVVFFWYLLAWPLVKFFDPTLASYHSLGIRWANIVNSIFYKTEVVGREKLPSGAAVYVANHQSWLDIVSLYQLRAQFKFVSKQSMFFFPLVGFPWMYIQGHIALKRGDSASGKACMSQCAWYLKRGMSVFIFPEGTRRKKLNGELGEFKNGAFKLAVDLGVPVVPVTIFGTAQMGLGPASPAKGVLPGAVKLIVHEPISPKDKTVEALSDAVRKVIAGPLGPTD